MSVEEVVTYVGDSNPALFIECYAGAGGTTESLLLRNRAKHGLLVVGDPYLAAFWQEALKTEELIRKVRKFKAREANIEEVINNPDRDPAFWTLVKSICSWKGRLDPKAFLEWDVAKFWNKDRIVRWLLRVRSLSKWCEIVQAQGVEVLESYSEATALLHYPFDFRWNEPLREKWCSAEEEDKLFNILLSRKGRWIIPHPSDRMCARCEASQIGAAWMIVGKSCSPRFFRFPILVSDRQFAAEQNERSYAHEKQVLEWRESAKALPNHLTRRDSL